jgi:hypothetical protein
LRINRFTVTVAVILLIFPLGLFIPAFMLQKTGRSDILVIMPADIHAPSFDIKKIETFCKDEFPLSYEIIEAEKASTPRAEIPVRLMGVNSLYLRLSGFPLIEGSFFSKESWDKKQKHAVLNEKAAFDLFGGSRIAGSKIKILKEAWLVTGVIDDGDDETARIYAPSSVRGGRVSSLLALLDASKDETYVKTSLKTLGVHEGSFVFFRPRGRIRLFFERAFVSLGLLCCLLILRRLPGLWTNFKFFFGAVRKKREAQYPREVLQKNAPLLAKTFLAALALPASGGILLFMLLKILSVCLTWQDLPPLEHIAADAFYPQFVSLTVLDTLDRVLFYAYLLCFGLFSIFLTVKNLFESSFKY